MTSIGRGGGRSADKGTGSKRIGGDIGCSYGQGCRREDPIVLSSDSSCGGGQSESFGPEPQMDAASNMVVATLYPPYTSQLEFFGTNVNWGPKRWVTLNTDSDRIYRVVMERRSNYHVLSMGWDLIVAVECLHVGDQVMLEYNDDELFMTVVYVATSSDRHPGFTNVPIPHGEIELVAEDYYVSKGTEVSETVMNTMKMMWIPLDHYSPMYVSTIQDSQKKDGSMFFSTEYSKVLPKKETVALRFVGSPVVICGSIHKYDSRVKRITQGWTKFVEEHGIDTGDTLVFRCYRGPNVWEIIVCKVAVI